MRTLLFLFIPFLFKGQILVEETVEPVMVGSFKKEKSDVELSYFVSGSDTTIHFTYKNENYSTDYKSLRFKGGLKNLEELYKLFLAVLISDDKKELRIKLGETNVSLSKNNDSLWFWTDAGYFTIKKEKDLRLLFGKKE
ncbi:MAG TPA: hypothetical protein VN026_13070 [Bacteroidia bacterium]|jgi:hypothetical protein|nr:hypothetical protein [Bacteroidia bacterium]